MESDAKHAGSLNAKEEKERKPTPTAQLSPGDAKKGEQPGKSGKKKELSDSDLPAPLANGTCKVILEELPEDSRIALESCLQFWRERRFPTEELVGFLKTISNQSPTLKKGFNDQHQGFLQAMKLQEEQQRRRQQEEMSQMQWAHYQGPMHPQHMHAPWPHHPMAPLHPYGYPPHPHHMQPVGPFVPVEGPAFHNDLGLAKSGAPSPADQGFLRPLDNRFSNWHLSHLNERVGQGRAHTDSPKRRGRGSADSLQKLTEAVEADGRSEGNMNPARVVTDLTHKRLKDKSEVSTPGTPMSDVPEVKKPPNWQPSEKDLADAKLNLGGFRPRALKDHPLAEFLTQRVQQVNPSVVVKVVADTRKSVPGGEEGEPAQRSGSYRCKGILVFRCLPGSVADAITFGMYTHEYGAKAPPSHRGRVLVDCIDSTPLYSGETPEERQRSLTSVVQGYLEWVGREGFAALLLRVPPPNDDAWHLFAQRSFDIRVRACQHMSSWFKGILQDAVGKRIVKDFRGSSALNFPGFPRSLLQERDLALEASFRQAAERSAGAGAGPGRMGDLGGLESAERFFVALLPPAPDEQRRLGEQCPFIYSHVAEQRLRLMSFCARNKLRFHTVPNAQYSTMILLKELQHQRLSLEPLQERPGRRSEEGWDEDEQEDSDSRARVQLETHAGPPRDSEPATHPRQSRAAPGPAPGAPFPPDAESEHDATVEGAAALTPHGEEVLSQDWLAEAESELPELEAAAWIDH